ncbi:class I SAM-dependent methyltransferase [Actinoplanes sp. NPDC049548]|uniref:class I SAM-dependent methyltransferase n=1 Tax=Actinoplanes sp. NPDC049548 TaxID=3155152 RepID=UPI00341C7125
MLSPEILDYYRRGGERVRLTAGTGRLEFLRTWDVLTRVLPPPPGRVLDVGGATGVYAEPLAAAGYAVHVVDPVPDHVDEAATLPGVTAQPGDARQLPVPDASADAVLMLGPLYHLLERADRLAAWREALRATRPGGVVVAALITRNAALFDGLVKNFFPDPEFRDLVDGVMRDGVHDSNGERFFTRAYFHDPREAAPEAQEAGLTGVRVLAVEGPLAYAGPVLGDILADPERTAVLLERMRGVEEDPGIHGATGHLLVIGHRGAH